MPGAQLLASFPGFPPDDEWGAPFYVRPTRPQGKAWERGCPITAMEHHTEACNAYLHAFVLVLF